VLVEDGPANTWIGGIDGGSRNLISNNNGSGVVVRGANTTLTYIASNNIGVDAEGEKALGNGGNGVGVLEATQTYIGGGETAQKYNVISGNTLHGVCISAVAEAPVTQVVDNYIGNAGWGSMKAIPNGGDGVRVLGGVVNLQIEGNWIAGNKGRGVRVSGECSQNRVKNNQIGLAYSLAQNKEAFLPNGTGCSGEAQDCAVLFEDGPYDVVVGGNSIHSKGTGVRFTRCGKATTSTGNAISYNRIGLTYEGTAAASKRGIIVEGCRATVTDNEVAGCQVGVLLAAATGGTSPPATFGSVWRNKLHDNGIHVVLYGGASGDLGVASRGTGLNRFEAYSKLCLDANGAPEGSTILAENNNWGTTSKAAIEARIGGVAKVDFIPIAGGVTPTRVAPAVLTLTSAAAQQTAQGAALTFTLSAPANVEVTITNIAGRPVRTVVRDYACDTGVNELTWNALSDGGTRLPAGRYLVMITARSEDGTQVQAVSPLTVGR